jgi:uncharacterized protein (UPF0218 family)
MQKSLEKAFHEIGIENPIQYIDDTIARLNQIEAAATKEQQIAKLSTSIGHHTASAISTVKSHLESMK